ncbi:hypothetical protein PAEPH01_1797 [Pancytospora epiphaga]|nr:hypothetical protein PAEPH01_1797 [Pancytospora epiphaga]
MEGFTNEQLVHQATVNLTKTAVNISNKIKEQTMILEEISGESRLDMDKFAKNSRVFDETITCLENDQRNKIIIVLLIIVLILVYYLRLK